MKILLLVCCALALSGCVTSPPPFVAPTLAELAAADCGPEPAAAEFAKAKAYMENVLKDPMSAVYKQGPNQRNGLARVGETFFGWEMVVLVNAKNSYGGYTGFQSYSFFFRDGKMIAELDPEDERYGRWTWLI